MRRERTDFPRAVATVLILASLMLTETPAARAGFDEVADLFTDGSWEQARGQAADAGTGARPAESLLWRSRLATGTTAALEFLREGLSQKRLGREVRARLALETADLELGRGHPSEALAVLVPLLNDGDELPGEVQAVAARALLAVGRGPRARELLAAVRAADPAFGLSRALLGDIAIAQGDGTQALLWYDAADGADPELRHRTVAGRCRAMLLGGRVGEVEALATQLEALDPGSLALLEVRRVLRDHKDFETTRLPGTPQPAGATLHSRGTVRDDTDAPSRPPSTAAPEARPERYTLQLGAFSDRDRALEFQRRHADRVEALTIEEGLDARGRSMYRLRTGAWTSATEAAAAASEMEGLLGLKVIVVDREADARPDR